MEKTKNCKVCGKEIAESANACQFCGARNNNPFGKKARLWLCGVALIIVFGLFIIPFIRENISDNNSFTNTTKTSSFTNTSNIAVEQVEKSEYNTEKVFIPTEYQLALAKAKSYNDLLPMSKKRLFEQLTSEYGECFSSGAAQYAIDNINADYKINALKRAEIYQKTMNMEKPEIYNVLIYGEKFTAEEAQYAIDSLK